MDIFSHESGIKFQQRGLHAFLWFQCLARFVFGLCLWSHYPLATYLCLGSALLAAVLAWLTPRLPINVMLILSGVDTLWFSWSMDHMFGWEAGFELHALWTIFAVFLFEHLPIWIRGWMAVLPMLMIIGVNLLTPSYQSHYELSASLLYDFKVGNLIYAVFQALAIMLYYSIRVEKQKAAAQDLAEGRGRLIQAMSHEMKTPIVAMLTQTQVAIERDAVSTDIPLLRKTENNLRNLSQLSPESPIRNTSSPCLPP